MATTYEANVFGRNQIKLAAGYQITTSLNLSAARTLTENDQRLIRVDPTAAGFTVTLPAGPSPGCEYTFKEVAGSANPVTISGNGKLIEGSATYVLNVPYRCRTLRYSDISGQWEVIGGVN